MQNDKEFKKKNDESYIKDRSPDMQLGRQKNISQNANAESKNQKRARKMFEVYSSPQNITGSTEDYNISETVQDSKEHFAKSRDMNFSEVAADKDSNIAFEKFANRAEPKTNNSAEKLPRKKKRKRQCLYNEETHSLSSRLHFEKESQPKEDIGRRSPARKGTKAVQYAAINKIHSKISEAESDNIAVESAHKTEQHTETALRFSKRTAEYASERHKSALYKRAAKLRYKAEMQAAYEKALKDNPQLAKSTLNKFRQKQYIKKQYQKIRRAEQMGTATAKTANLTGKTTKKLAAFLYKKKSVFGIVLLLIVMFAFVSSALSSCSVMMASSFNSIMVSSYFADDEDIYKAEDYYSGLELDLQKRIDRIEKDYSDYDEYNYNLAQIGHNPYELISYLTAVHMDFKFKDIKDDLDKLFNSQYHLRITERREQRTDENGDKYTYKILNVTLTNDGMTKTLTAEQMELYSIYLESKGNRDYLFADDIYANPGTDYPNYVIPGDALTDETFRRLITEAEKYLGYPYVWGGSSPSTSFDCSGFVCWVFRKSGVYPLSRTTAQGIYNQCAKVRPADAKPGDIIFFTGTYNSSGPVSHVGIYVGNGMMIHAGSPIQYANVNSKYWRQHFYAYGRLR